MNKKKNNFNVLIWPLLSLLFFAILLLMERSGVQYTLADTTTKFVPKNIMNMPKPASKAECLLLYDSKSDVDYHKNIEFVLNSMSVGYKLVDVSGKEGLPSWNQYKTVLIALSNLDHMQNDILSLMEWVKDGGKALFVEIPEPNATLWVIYDELGICNDKLDYVSQSGVKLLTDLLPGGKGQTFHWNEGLRKELGVLLNDDCKVHMVSAGKTEIPMIWERNLGKGKIVVNNNDMLDEKLSRGLVAAEYSLLSDVFAYPVINASVFFIDDFPAPLPEGYNDIINKDYQCDTKSFYINTWFPDMMTLARHYGLKYTTMLIETYDDNVEPPFEPLDNIDYFPYFGKLLLDHGDEIGLHGYNHMSYVLENFDYKGLLDYKKWRNKKEMAEATSEAVRYTKELFPDIELKTYVAPSNVLSVEGRAMLREKFPQFNTFAGVYTDYDYGIEQEFDVGEDGIIDFPRIASGYNLDDAYRWAVISELGFHYVNSYFIHPDDVLDVERSQGKTWRELKEDFNKYLDWLYDSAKGIRNLTAQGGAKAVQRYSKLSIDRSETKEKLNLNIGGFYDEAWFLVRFNKSKPGIVDGGSVEYVTDNLYLLHAKKDHVVITLER